MPKKKTTEEFIADARKVHGDRYDYSKVVYQGSDSKVCVICKKHGEFFVDPGNHLSRKSGCPKCKSEAARARYLMSTEEFIKKATEVHGDRYDYSKVDYQGTDRKVCIICHKRDSEGKEHGDFWQVPHNHLHGFGCPKCSGNYVQTSEEFINSLKEVFGDAYDYSKVEYHSRNSRIRLICPQHGEFVKTASNLLAGHGCNKCIGNYGIDFNWFVQRANEVHSGKYDYSESVWNGYKQKLAIRCPEHGTFYQMPVAHLQGQGCPKCSGKVLDKDMFLKKAYAIHGDKYDYSQIDFKGARVKLKIICPKHGPFWQDPRSHVNSRSGCPICAQSHLEEKVRQSLIRNNIQFQAEKTFSWLTHESMLPLDFYLPDYRIAIECQGEQHFRPVDFFGGKERWQSLQVRDRKKKELCNKMGIQVLYYSEFPFDYPYPVITNLDLLIRSIKENETTTRLTWEEELPLSFE